MRALGLDIYCGEHERGEMKTFVNTLEPNEQRDINRTIILIIESGIRGLFLCFFGFLVFFGFLFCFVLFWGREGFL